MFYIRKRSKCLKQSEEIHLRTPFTVATDTHARLLRSSSSFQLYTPKPHLEIYRYSGPSIWNSCSIKMAIRVRSYIYRIYLFTIVKDFVCLLYPKSVQNNITTKNQPLLDYFWDISRDWERLQRTTTLHGRLWDWGCSYLPFFPFILHTSTRWRHNMT